MIYKVAYINSDVTRICFKNLEGPQRITFEVIAAWEKELNEDYDYTHDYITVVGWNPVHTEGK
jgi:hypothetical protein